MDYDDIPDDWEVEAEEEEQRERQEEALKAAKNEKKLKARATGKVEETVEEEEAVASDIQAEMDVLRQVAQDIAGGSDALSGEKVELIAESPAATVEDSEKIGVMIAEHLLSFQGSCDLTTLLTAFAAEIGQEYDSVDEICKSISSITVAKNTKKSKKAAKKHEAAEKPKPAEPVAHVDPVEKKSDLDFMDVEDRGGAEVEDNENPW
ncbi:translation initiation factor 3 subunit J [Angomonas deanei]|nr:translation initiation factor 3 subunit J [Angomonas deanei]|eukprot:EPY34889.1 translation initiation factor 3 subunit J [Angomonas deanei]